MDALQVAKRVVKHGTPYTTAQTHEGSDYFFSTKQIGLRWGQLKLQVQANGSLVFYREGRSGYPLCWTTIFDSSSTGRYLGHWDSIERRVLRTAVQQLVAQEADAERTFEQSLTVYP